MPNYNRVFLMGHLTRDPQISYTPSQTAVVDFGIATNYQWHDQSGNKREEVCFIDCRAFGKKAETINQYFSKGSPIFIDGRLSFDRWEAQDGSKRNKHRIIVQGFQFFDSSNRNENEERPRNDTKARGTAVEDDDDAPF